MNSVKQAIKNYLDERAKTDELFAKAYAKPNKSIDECFNYIVGEARKQGGSAVYVSDEVVFGWAVHYYDEDDIKVSKLPSGTSVSARTSIELTEEEKEEARKKAMKAYERQCMEEMKAAEEAKAKKEAEKRKARREELRRMEETMPSLFNFEEGLA